MGLEARERTLLYHTATRCTSSRVVDLGLVPPYAPIETQEGLYFSHSCRKNRQNQQITQFRARYRRATNTSTFSRNKLTAISRVHTVLMQMWQCIAIWRMQWTTVDWQRGYEDNLRENEASIAWGRGRDRKFWHRSHAGFEDLTSLLFVPLRYI